jgi:hypothetical protein
MPKIDKGPIIGVVKFRSKGRKDLRRAQSWANRVDLQIRRENGFIFRQNLTPFDAAYRLLFEVLPRQHEKGTTDRFAKLIESTKTQQITFRELQIKTFLEQEMAREVVEA